MQQPICSMAFPWHIVLLLGSIVFMVVSNILFVKYNRSDYFTLVSVEISVALVISAFFMALAAQAVLAAIVIVIVSLFAAFADIFIWTFFTRDKNSKKPFYVYITGYYLLAITAFLFM